MSIPRSARHDLSATARPSRAPRLPTRAHVWSSRRSTIRPGHHSRHGAPRPSFVAAHVDKDAARSSVANPEPRAHSPQSPPAADTKRWLGRALDFCFRWCHEPTAVAAGKGRLVAAAVPGATANTLVRRHVRGQRSLIGLCGAGFVRGVSPRFARWAVLAPVASPHPSDLVGRPHWAGDAGLRTLWSWLCCRG